MKKHLAKTFASYRIRKLILACFAIGLFVNFSSFTVQAETDSSVTDFIQQNNEKEPSQKQEKPSMEKSNSSAPQVGLTVWDYIKTGLALVFVIALIYGLVKLVNTRNRITQHGKLMKNMGGLSLGQQKSIQIVKIGDRFYIVGVGDDVHLLKEISDPEELSQLVSYYDQDEDTPQQSPILKLLEALKPSEKNPYQKQEQPEQFGTMFKNKLTEIENERKRKLNKLTEKERNRND